MYSKIGTPLIKCRSLAAQNPIESHPELPFVTDISIYLPIIGRI